MSDATGAGGSLTESFPAELADIAKVVERHKPARPTWTCHVDGRPWPCAAARIHLRSRYSGDQIGLSIYMSGQLMAAAVDLTQAGAMPADLFHRFVGWTRLRADPATAPALPPAPTR